MTDTLAGGRYAIVRRLAQGGMGDVLLADFRGDTAMGLTPGLVVLKRVLTDHPNRSHQATMLREEGRVGLRLLHDNVVETFLTDEHNGDPILVMEYLSGRALSQVLGQAKKRKERVPVEVALSILRGAACGLHFAHTLTDRGRPLGLIHRDISPANIFVTFDGRVKVIDFGVAKADDSEIRTSTGILKGKLGYMSPQHAMGEKLTPASDLWSLGVCFWESLCAERLFAHSTPSATLTAISERQVPSPFTHRPDLPPHIERLCMSLLERDMDKRINSCAQLVQAIDALPEAASLQRLDVGGWLAGRFPEEAATGKEEAARAARLRRRQPVPMGLVEGTAVVGVEEAPTLIIGASQSIEARDLLAQEAATSNEAATVRMKLSDIPISMGVQQAADLLGADDNLPTRRIPGGLLAEAGSDEHALEPMPETIPIEFTAARPLPGPVPKRTPTSPGPAPRPVTSPGVRPASSTGSLAQPTATLPILDRQSSWVGVAFLTFGALALAMGVAFSFLAPRATTHYVAAYEDPTGQFDILVAEADAPPSGRRIDVTRPELKMNGVRAAMDPSELSRRLESSGVRARAALPTTPRGTVALLLPVLIAGLGLLALAGALPTLLLSSKKSRMAAQLVLIALCLASLLVVVKSGALSWPGLDAWRSTPRLELSPAALAPTPTR